MSSPKSRCAHTGKVKINKLPVFTPVVKFKFSVQIISTMVINEWYIGYSNFFTTSSLVNEAKRNYFMTSEVINLTVSPSPVFGLVLVSSVGTFRPQ